MRSLLGGLAAWRFGGLAVALLALAPMADLKADVVTLSNSVNSTNSLNTKVEQSLFIYFTTTTTTGGAFQLGTLKLFGSSANRSVSWSLQNLNGNTVNNISNTTNASINGTNGLTLTPTTGTGLFGAGSYWLVVTGLPLDTSNTYTGATNATMSGTGLGVSNATQVSAVNQTAAISYNGVYTNTNIYQAELTVNVPEPATMILTGSALVAGAIGAFLIKRW